MTYTFTHLSLEGLLVWLLLSKKEKSYFQTHRWQFLLINIFATVPDIDVFFGYHRSYTHSLIIPIVFLLALTTAKIIRGEELGVQRGTRILKAFRLICWMWILHIILDLGWGPILLFWPVDNHYYDLSVYLRFSNEQWWIFPLMLIGVIPNWTIYQFQEGRRVFFINLTQQEREQLYGHFFDFPIEQIGMHALIFLVWAVVLLVPALKRKRKDDEKLSSKKISKYFESWKLLTRSYTLIGISFMFLGLVLGPIIGQTYTQNHSISVDLTVTDTKFDPWLAVGLTNEGADLFELSYSINQGKVPCNTSILLVQNASFSLFYEQVMNATNEFENDTITMTQMYGDYHMYLEKLKTESIYYKQLRPDQTEITILLNDTFFKAIDAPIYFVGAFENWNETKSFIYTVHLEITSTSERVIEQIGGLVLTTLGAMLICFDQITAIVTIKHKIEVTRIYKKP
ncbi:MAG: metal-dependent hydrolase [Candidatus Heimdallarchaeaceae archaeon]